MNTFQFGFNAVCLVCVKSSVVALMQSRLKQYLKEFCLQLYIDFISEKYIKRRRRNIKLTAGSRLEGGLTVLKQQLAAKTGSEYPFSFIRLL